MTHPIIIGTNGNDTIIGTSNDDTILGNAGNDVITAGNGDDRVDGGDGNDTINAGSGDDEVDGGNGIDIINGEAGDDALDGENGNDTIDGGSGNDLIDGDNGDDILKGGAGLDLISGGDGDDTITGGTGNDLIYGGHGTDTAIFAGTYATLRHPQPARPRPDQRTGRHRPDARRRVPEVRRRHLQRRDRTFTHQPPTVPVVSVAATDGSGTEAIDGTDFTFTFTRTGDLSQALTVNYAIVPAATNGATPGADFPAQTGTITFAAGSATAVLQFSAIDDAFVENTEGFSVVLVVGTGYQVDVPNATANGSISDNDVSATGRDSSAER